MRKKVQHTPGPWTVQVADDGSSLNSLDIVGPDPRITVAIIIDEESSDRRDTKMQQEWANARLIAAAPELANLVLRTWAHVSHGGPTRAEAKALLKKAGVL